MDDQPQTRSWCVTTNGWLAYGVAVAVVVVDQLSKWLILKVVDLPHREPIQILPFLHLTMVWNPGVSFGLLRPDSPTGRWLLVAFALAIVVGLALWARNIERRITALSLGLIIGGAIGNNLIDRVRFGAVADFVDFHTALFPWIFNVADSAISVGVALLLLESLVRPKPEVAT